MAENANIILFVVNAPEFFLSHRLPLAVAAQQTGFQVHVATADGPDVQRIQSLGFTHHIVPFVRSGQNPLNELATLLRLVKLFRRVKPTLVHLIIIKPVLYGGVAARLAGIKSVVSAVSGFGYRIFGGFCHRAYSPWVGYTSVSCSIQTEALGRYFSESG